MKKYFVKEAGKEVVYGWICISIILFALGWSINHFNSNIQEELPGDSIQEIETMYKIEDNQILADKTL